MDPEDRQIPYDFIYMQNLKSKINEQTKQSKNRLIDTENNLIIARGERSWDWMKEVKRINSYKVPAIK